MYLPSEADPAGWQRPSPRAVALDGERAVLLVPGSAQVLCLHVRTGHILWTALRPDAKALLGNSGESIAILTDAAVEALDAGTGRSLWRRGIAGDSVGMLAGPRRDIMLLRWQKGEKNRLYTWRLEWLSISDGRTIAETTMGDLEFAPGRALHSDGASLYVPLRTFPPLVLRQRR